MSLSDVAVPAAPSPSPPVVNDFSIQVATVNGSGSQTANLVLLRSIFQMGVPVSGKNMFPSNIAGLPTWYTIRANKHGYIARKKEVDFLVAMNPETAREDVLSLEPGTAVLYDEPLKLNGLRDDLIFYPVPFDKIVAEVCKDAKLRRLVKNMIYDGVLSKLLNIDMTQMENALQAQLGKKQKAIELNMAALEAGFAYAEQHLPKRDPYWVEPMDKTTGQILIEGNAAAALGCMFAGVTVVAWYPITPSSSLPETLIGYLKKYRMDPETGKATYAVVQAEDEIASIGMVVGAGWAGARAMTSTSGPGISLMGEFAGLAYYAEVPGVVFDIQRVGPSTGLPTRTAQGDLLSTAVLSHGDTKQIMLIPASVEECYTMAMEAFDLAERFQVMVFVMSDLDLGMNNWMSQPFTYPDKPLDRGKRARRRDARAHRRMGTLQGRRRRRHPISHRFPDEGMPRLLHARLRAQREGPVQRAPGRLRAQHGAAGAQVRDRAHATCRSRLSTTSPTPASASSASAPATGRSKRAAISCEKEYGLKTAYLRLRAYPFTDELTTFLDRYERIYIVEQNRDAQMLALMRLDITADHHAKVRSVLHYSGLPIDARSVTDDILQQEGIRAVAEPHHEPMAAGIAGRGE